MALCLAFTCTVRFTDVAVGRSSVIVICTSVMPTIPGAAPAKSGVFVIAPRFNVTGSANAVVGVAEAWHVPRDVHNGRDEFNHAFKPTPKCFAEVGIVCATDNTGQ